MRDGHAATGKLQMLDEGAYEVDTRVTLGQRGTFERGSTLGRRDTLERCGSLDRA